MFQFNKPNIELFHVDFIIKYLDMIIQICSLLKCFLCCQFNKLSAMDTLFFGNIGY